MITLKSYFCGEWQAGDGDGRPLFHAVTGEQVAACSTDGFDFKAMLEYGRNVGGPALRAMTFPQRGELLKKMAGVLNAHLPEFYEIAAAYGATKKDAWVDIEGGIGTLFVYSGLGRKALPDKTFLVDGEVAGLSKGGTFVGRHIHVPLEGVAVQINAYNFPAWGMLEKLVSSILAGMPALVKPATSTCWLTYAMVEKLIESGVMPDGTLQLVCGSVGDLLDHMTCQDVLGFTGSARVGNKLKAHPTIVSNSVRFNMEADSLNCIVLGSDVGTDSPTFGKFIREIINEMRTKAGQKCTAIRRILVPQASQQAVVDALKAKLAGIVVGDPAVEGVKMGPLVNQSALRDAREGIAVLAEEAEIVHGDPQRNDFEGGTADKGAFLEPILLSCKDASSAVKIHEVEVFGPAATVIGYTDDAQAVELARRGGGSLVATLYSEDDALASKLTFGLAPYHGRLLLMNDHATGESTGHGIAMPQLVHGGPGRAGGGEELGGLRSIYHYMQRTALQGSPERLEAICS